jgi:hypothetical protein
MVSNPRVYVSGLHKMHLNIRKMLEWILHALVLAAVVFWIPFAVFKGSSGQWDHQYVVLSCPLWLSRYLTSSRPRPNPVPAVFPPPPLFSSVRTLCFFSHFSDVALVRVLCFTLLW